MKTKKEPSSGSTQLVNLLTGFNVDIHTDLEQSLLSTEKLDRASPDIWPERNCKYVFKKFRINGYCNKALLNRSRDRVCH